MSRKHLQNQIRALSEKGARIALKAPGHSNTTRSKSYNKNASALDLSSLNRILKIDPQKKTAVVESRVTMDQLVKATLSFGLIPPVVPEFKGITVGGAIMGAAAESGSHRWGIFSDLCLSYTLICGDGSLIETSPEVRADLFHAIPGSYGSLGLLVATEIRLITALPSVHLRYTKTSNPLLSSDADFLDGIVFSKEQTMKIEGWMSEAKPTQTRWYFEEASHEGETILPLYTYLFRYDPGAFWMGAYLFNVPFLARFFFQGLLKFPSKPQLTQKEITKRPTPSPFWLQRLPSQRLWKLLHKAEEWIQERFVIQDFCLPISKAACFLNQACQTPAIFPIWLCPIKQTQNPQIFAPHKLSEPILNIGLYGLPAKAQSIKQITKELERKTTQNAGRKVLYSRSYYTPEEFWEIYDEWAYQKLRDQTAAVGVWPSITEKVLSR